MSKTPSPPLQVDCVAEQELCQEYGVRGYPTLIVFQDGERKSDYRQARDLQSLITFLDGYN